jgi:thiol-disulfide isomerase/thioredoxin
MPFLRYYSVLIAWALLLVVGFSVVKRRGNRPRDRLFLGGVLLFLLVMWLVLRPVTRNSSTNNNLPLLLELQSPYCLICLVTKPAVDRLENELRGKLVVRRVNVQSADGKSLMAQYNAEGTPTFIYLDPSGTEQWRCAGKPNLSEVRALVESKSKQ